ncbi:MAG: glycosyltransferase family 9 protein [Elusimicrobiota bacterium]
MHPPRRILVIMLRRIGDVILTTPAVRALRRLYPDAVIDFLVEPPAHELLAGDPDISNVLVYGGADLPLRRGLPRTLRALWDYVYWPWRVFRSRYDWVIDFMGNPRTAVLTFLSRAGVRAGPGRVSHRWAYTHRLRQPSEACYGALEKIRMLRSLGLDPDESDALPRLSPDPSSEEFARATLNRLPEPAGPLIGVVPASRRVTRRWPAESFARLGRMLRDRHGASLLVFWGPGERELARRVRDGIGEGAHLSPETKSLRELAALVGRCRLVVTNCNGPKHIAVGRGVPTLTIHGSSDPVSWTPMGDVRHRASRLDLLHCIGCRRNRCPYSLECMTELTAEQVCTTAENLLRLTGNGRLPG